MNTVAGSRSVARGGALALLVLLAGTVVAAIGRWEFLDPILAPLCHQRSDRCFAINGHAMAICARCLGIYVGLLVVCLWGSFRSISVTRSGAVLIAALAFNGCDAFLEWQGVYGNLRWMRWGLGLALGMAIAVFVFSKTGRRLGQGDTRT